MAGVPHDVDPEGDLILAVGPDRTPIRVSSKVLGLASPVFNKMLDSPFAEGRLLSKRASLRSSTVPPIQIDLPEDDPEAMIMFCNTVHIKRQATPDISLPLFERMASLSDKYDSSLALSSGSEVWLSRDKSCNGGQIRYARMLWIFYALDNHCAFSRISRTMIRFYNEDELRKQVREIESTSLPVKVISKLALVAIMLCCY